jgi:hypothetical protein
MQALVINPWATDFKLYDEWMHPVGLYFLISFLKHNDIDVRYFNCLERTGDAKSKKFGTGDFQHCDLPKPAIYRSIKRKYKRYGRPVDELKSFLRNHPSPAAIFVGSAMTYWMDGLDQTIDIIAEIHPAVPIIIGGIATTLLPGIVKLQHTGATIFGGSLTNAADVARLRSLEPILGSLSTDGWSPGLVDAFSMLENPTHAPVLTSLGCPFACAYCASRELQGAYQSRQIDMVTGEIRMASSKGVRDFSFYDDALLYRPEERFLPFAQALHESSIKARFHTPNGLHLRWVTPEIAAVMRSLNFETLRFGYESGDDSFRQETCGKSNRELLKEKLAILRNAGFPGRTIGIYVMGGLPDQRPQTMRDEIDYVACLGARVQPVFLSPVPGTGLFDHYRKDFPELSRDPHWQNDTFFITRLPGWSEEKVEEIKRFAKERNARLA